MCRAFVLIAITHPSSAAHTRLHRIGVRLRVVVRGTGPEVPPCVCKQRAHHMRRRFAQLHRAVQHDGRAAVVRALRPCGRDTGNNHSGRDDVDGQAVGQARTHRCGPRLHRLRLGLQHVPAYWIQQDHTHHHGRPWRMAVGRLKSHQELLRGGHRGRARRAVGVGG